MLPVVLNIVHVMDEGAKEIVSENHADQFGDKRIPFYNQ